MLKTKNSIAGMLIALGVLLTFQQVFAQDWLINLNNIDPDETQYTGFVLNSEQEVEIEAIGLHRREQHYVNTNCWILNASNREVVWELTDSNSKWLNRKLRQYNDRVSLPAGTYELYYSVYTGYHNNNNWSFGDFFFGDKDAEYFEDVMEKFEVKLRANGRVISKGNLESMQADLKKKAVVALLTRHEDEYLNQGFELKRPTDIIIYALGEARRDGSFDYGWIMNVETRQRVWDFTYRNTDHAGGSKKNRMSRETLSLPAGKYAAFYITDDSHSPVDWNAPPPYDPAFWGLSIYLKNDSDRGNLSLFDYENVKDKNVIIGFTGLRDDEFVSKGFTLKKDMQVRVYAIGEGSDGEMYDYGWIVDAKTRERVWEMKYRRTEHAGGADKNRLVDKVIDLKKGSYLAYFVTDGSHSFKDWNSAPPFDQEAWGMTLTAATSNFNKQDVGEYNEAEDKSILVKIAGVGDWETKKERLTLKNNTKIRIYAIGEGSDGRMYDYGWIENANTNTTVWEMTYRKTDHAGGAKKNRLFDGSILLEAGEYYVYYETDDSHSFKDWNSSAPHDPQNWGITIFKVSD